MDIADMADQLDSLIGEYERLAASARQRDLSDKQRESKALSYRLEAAIDRIAPPGSTYVRQVDRYRNTGRTYDRLSAMVGIATSLRADLQSGWVESVIALVHADTQGDFLEMADDLLSGGYKDAAAVVAGTALEVHLKAACARMSIDIEINGRSKKADLMNADLKKEGLYEGLQQKQVTAWLALRNDAAHGNYQSYERTDVRQLIDGVRAFVSKYPA